MFNNFHKKYLRLLIFSVFVCPSFRILSLYFLSRPSPLSESSELCHVVLSERPLSSHFVLLMRSNVNYSVTLLCCVRTSTIRSLWYSVAFERPLSGHSGIVLPLNVHYPVTLLYCSVLT